MYVDAEVLPARRGRRGGPIRRRGPVQGPCGPAPAHDARSLRVLDVEGLARADDEVCVCDFTAALPLNQPTVSHHLRILREVALVTCERRGTWVYYRLATDARERIDAATRSLIPERALA